MSEIDEICYGFKGIVNLMGDGTGEATDSSELFGLEQSLFRALGPGGVDAKNNDSRDRPIRFSHWLVDEIQGALFEFRRPFAGKANRRIAADEGFASAIDSIEQIDKALFLHFRHRFEDGLSNEIARTEEPFVLGIYLFEDMLRATEQGEERRSLLKEL